MNEPSSSFQAATPTVHRVRQPVESAHKPSITIEPSGSPAARDHAEATLTFEAARADDHSPERRPALWPLVVISLGSLLALIWAAFLAYAVYALLDWLP